MIDQNTFILVSVAASFTIVGVLAWLVDAGISEKAKVLVKYTLFGLFAVVIGMFFLIKDDSEFEYADWTPAKAGGGGGGGGGLGMGGGGGGNAAMKGGGGDGGTATIDSGSEVGEGTAEIEVPAEEEDDDEQEAKPIQDCPMCPEVVSIKSGSALIGSPLTIVAKGAQSAPASEVTIRSGFGIGKYEVTFEQFKAFVTETGYTPAKSCRIGAKRHAWGSYANPGFKQGASNPVVCVSWKDAIAYADWLTQKTGTVYRLPTEIEWEYAARAGVTGAYSQIGPITGELANFADRNGRRRGRTAPVGSYPANGNGLHDVHGNVWEMTLDCWSNGYLGMRGKGKSKGIDCMRRIAKGGAWFSAPEHLNFALRVGVKTDFANNGLGFRIVREQSAPTVHKESRLSNGFAGGAPTGIKIKKASK